MKRPPWLCLHQELTTSRVTAECQDKLAQAVHTHRIKLTASKTDCLPAKLPKVSETL